jgi:hypothetical protein
MSIKGRTRPAQVVCGREDSTRGAAAGGGAEEKCESARVRECESARVRECESAGVRECGSAWVVLDQRAPQTAGADESAAGTAESPANCAGLWPQAPLHRTSMGVIPKEAPRGTFLHSAAWRRLRNLPSECSWSADMPRYRLARERLKPPLQQRKAPQTARGCGRGLPASHEHGCHSEGGAARNRPSLGSLAPTEESTVGMLVACRYASVPARV